MSYKYHKVNLSWFRSIHNLIRDFPLFFSVDLESKIWKKAYREFQNKLIFKKIRINKFVRRKKQEYIEDLDQKEIENIVIDFYNSNASHHTEAIMLNDYHVMSIRKNSDPLLDKEKIVQILIHLKNNKNYIAEYGLSSIANINDIELIDLNDFNFRFENRADIERNIHLLQILDSDHLTIRNLDDFYSRSIHHKPIFNKLKEKKILKEDDRTLIYLDKIDFEIFDRLPNNYPDKKQAILEDEDVMRNLLS